MTFAVSRLPDPIPRAGLFELGRSVCIAHQELHGIAQEASGAVVSALRCLCRQTAEPKNERHSVVHLCRLSLRQPVAIHMLARLGDTGPIDTLDPLRSELGESGT